ncbi:MAG: AAA family ATPase [bacterium]|nr:AAA family ATPase [bacterium]
MAQIIAVSNQKGGVGKTTTCVNLSASLALMGKRTLLLDFDPQGNATSGLGFRPQECEQNIYPALIGRAKIADQIIDTEIKNLKLIPANVDLTGGEIELVGAMAREMKLKRIIDELRERFDYILIDCPPTLSLLTLNSLVAADSVLIPLQCEYYAMEGLSQLLVTINLVKETLNPQLVIEGVLPTMYDVRNNISKQVIDEVKIHFKDQVFKSVIPRNVRLSEAPSFGKPVFLYDRTSKGAIAYLSLAKEMLAKHRALS